MAPGGPDRDRDHGHAVVPVPGGAWTWYVYSLFLNRWLHVRRSAPTVSRDTKKLAHEVPVPVLSTRRWEGKWRMPHELRREVKGAERSSLRTSVPSRGLGQTNAEDPSARRCRKERKYLLINGTWREEAKCAVSWRSPNTFAE